MLTCEQVWEFNWQNDSFFEGLLGPLQPSHIIPPNVGLLHHDSTCGGRQSRRPGAQPHVPLPLPRGSSLLPISCSCSFFFSGLSPSLSLSLLGKAKEDDRLEQESIGRKFSERGRALAASTVVKGCFPCSTGVTDPQTRTRGHLGPTVDPLGNSHTPSSFLH